MASEDGSEPSTTAPWAVVEELFQRALAQPEDELDSFLDHACTGLPEVRKEVVALLEAYHDPPTLLERRELFEASGGKGHHGAEVLGAGKRIGSYRIIEVLGRGGMGIVYRAVRERTDFSQMVALKVVEGHSPSLAQRLASEKRILAGLGHPNIAQFLDGGVSAEGLPYLAMEYVPGENLLTFCDEKRATLDQRLALFETVCTAVAAAHQNLVVHNDLKPSNILVTPEGVVKLLDFGIAKLLRRDEEIADPHNETTGSAPRFLTLECSAPEILAGQQSGTAADVYSLGVLLYRLLSGYRPYDFNGLGTFEALRRIGEDDIPPPSAQELTPEMADARGTTPRRLRRALTGDLDTIALTALERSIDRRYGSVTDLLEDIRLHRQRRPIHARGSSWLYRTQKAARRHWFGGLMTILLVGSLAAGTFVSLQGRQAAERQTRRAELVSELLLDLFSLASPNESFGQSIDAGDLLDKGVERVEKRFADRPDLQIGLFRVLGSGYTRLGRFEDAQEQLDKSIRLGGLEPVPGDRQPEQLLLELGELARMSGRYPEAEGYFLQLLARVERIHPQSRIAADVHNGLGVLYRSQGKYPEAQESLDRAVQILRDLEPINDVRVELGRSLSNLALVHSRLGNLDRSEALLLEGLDEFIEILGPDSSYAAAAFTNLAVLLRRKGELERAEPYYRQALQMRRRLYSGDHPAVAQSLNNLGAFWYHRRDLEKAEAFYAEALEMWQRTVEVGHPDMAATLLNLSSVRRRQGNFGEAAKGFRQAIDWQQRSLAPNHPDLGHSWLQLARVRIELGETAGARQDATKALTMFDESLGQDHLRTRRARATLVSVLVRAGDCSRARKEAAALRKSADSPSDSADERAHRALADC